MKNATSPATVAARTMLPSRHQQPKMITSTLLQLLRKIKAVTLTYTVVSEKSHRPLTNLLLLIKASRLLDKPTNVSYQ
jgi:hypothetical protein